MIVLAIWLGVFLFLAADALIKWRIAWLAKDAQYIAGLIHPPRKLHTGADESLPIAAARRRSLAEGKQREAAHILTQEPQNAKLLPWEARR